MFINFNFNDRFYRRWGEVDFLLRRRIENEEDIQYTTDAAEAGLLFIEQVHILCYVMLCHVMLCYVVLCHVMLCYVTVCCVMSCHVMSCCVMLCHGMLCYVILYHVMLCHVMLSHVT